MIRAGRLSVVRMSVLPKAIYRFCAILIKTPITFFFFWELEKPVLKFMWNLKEPQITKPVLKGDNRVGGLSLPDFKAYLQATVVKAAQTGVKTGRDQRSGIESGRPLTHMVTGFLTGGKIIQWERTVFSKSAGKTGCPPLP